MVLRDVLQTHSGVDPDIPDDRDRQKNLHFRRSVPTGEAVRRGSGKSEEGFHIPDHKQHGDRISPSRVSAPRESETALVPRLDATLAGFGFGAGREPQGDSYATPGSPLPDSGRPEKQEPRIPGAAQLPDNTLRNRPETRENE